MNSFAEYAATPYSAVLQDQKLATILQNALWVLLKIFFNR